MLLLAVVVFWLVHAEVAGSARLPTTKPKPACHTDRDMDEANREKSVPRESNRK